MDNNDNIAKQAERPGMDVYDWVLIFRDLTLDLTPTVTSLVSILGGIWLFAFSDLPPERMNTLAVFLGGGSMAQVASPSKTKQRLKKK